MRTTFTATCAECPWTGTTDSAADKHTKSTGHGTITSIRPERASDAAFPQVSGTIGGTSEGPRIAAETPLTTEAIRGPK